MVVQLQSGDNDSISFIHTHFGSGRYRQPLVRGFLSCKRVFSVCTNFCNFCRPSRRLDHHLLVPCTQGCTRTLVFLYAPRTSFPPHTLLPCSFLSRKIVSIEFLRKKKRSNIYNDYYILDILFFNTILQTLEYLNFA